MLNEKLKYALIYSTEKFRRIRNKKTYRILSVARFMRERGHKFDWWHGKDNTIVFGIADEFNDTFMFVTGLHDRYVVIIKYWNWSMGHKMTEPKEYHAGNSVDLFSRLVFEQLVDPKIMFQAK